MFSDESHFEVYGHRSQYVRRSVGETVNNFYIQQAPKRLVGKEDVLGMLYI